MYTSEDPVTDAEWDRFTEQIDESIAADQLERPLADPGREDLMRGWMSEAASPEEWVARYSDGLGSWSGGDLSYSDPTLNAWVRRLAAIFSFPGGTDVCRRRFLSSDELRAAREREWDL